MSAFEDFVQTELPRRSPHLTQTITGYDGDPNDVAAPAILQNSPLGTWFREQTAGIWWRKTETVWVDTSGGGLAGPGTTTDNAVVRWDGVDGSAVQNSGVTISDTDALSVPGDLLSPGSGGATTWKGGSVATATAAGTIALGNAAQSQSTSGIAIGDTALVSSSSTGAIAIGASTTATGTDSVVIGNSGSSADIDCVCVGGNAVSNGFRNVVIGKLARGGISASHNYSVAIGWDAQANERECVAIGAQSRGGFRTVTIGYQATLAGGVAIGYGVGGAGNNVVVVGMQANASGSSISVLGYQGRSYNNGCAVGYQARCYTNSVALGYQANYDAADTLQTPTADSGVFIGYTARGENSTVGSIAIGRQAQSMSSYGVAIGHSSSVPAGNDNGIALGRSATVAAGDQCVVGSTTAPLKIVGYEDFEIANVTNNEAGTVVAGDVVVMSGTRGLVLSTSANQKGVMVVRRGAAASAPTEVARYGYAQVYVTASTAVAVGDTLVASATAGTATVDNAETDPSRIIGYAWEAKTTGGAPELVAVRLGP